MLEVKVSCLGGDRPHDTYEGPLVKGTRS